MAAKGKYSPGRWQTGGTSLACLAKNPTGTQGVMGPFRSGHPDVSPCSSKLISSDTSMKGGSGCSKNRMDQPAEYKEAHCGPCGMTGGGNCGAVPVPAKQTGGGPGCGCGTLMGGARRRGRRSRTRRRRVRTKRRTRRGTRRRTRRRSGLRRGPKVSRMRRVRRSTRRRRRTSRGGGGSTRSDSNVPLAHGYSVGGQLSANDSALANPPPIEAYNHCKLGAQVIPQGS